MSDMSAEDHQVIPMPSTGKNNFFSQLQEKASRHTNLTLQDLKPLIDDALIFLKNTTDFASKEVADVLYTLSSVPIFLMNEKNSSILDIDLTKLTFIYYKVGQYLLQNGVDKSVVHIARLLHEIISGITSKKLEAQCQYNLLLLYQLIVGYTNVYPVKDTTFCYSICEEGILDMLKVSLVYFDVPSNKLPVAVNGQNLTIWAKMHVLAILFNCIAACSENKSLYQQVKIIDVLAKINRLSEDVKLIVLLIVAYTVDEAEPNEMLSNSVGTVKYLIELLKKAVHSVNHFCSTGAFVILSRYLLDGLNILSSNNDANKLAILKHGGIPVIIRMLQPDFSEDEIQLATKTLRNLGVVKKIKREIGAQLHRSGDYDSIVSFVWYGTVLE